MKEQLPFWVLFIGNPGLIQKLKVPKCVCRSTLANFCNEPSLFPIFGPARGQIFGKTAEKNNKKSMDFCLFWTFYIGISVVAVCRGLSPEQHCLLPGCRQPLKPTLWQLVPTRLLPSAVVNSFLKGPKRQFF